MAAAAALEANPNDPEALYRLGVTFASRGRVDVAMIQFRRAIEIRPNYAEAHYQLGLALAKKGKARSRHRLLPSGSSVQTRFRGSPPTS